MADTIEVCDNASNNKYSGIWDSIIYPHNKDFNINYNTLGIKEMTITPTIKLVQPSTIPNSYLLLKAADVLEAQPYIASGDYYDGNCFCSIGALARAVVGYDGNSDNENKERVNVKIDQLSTTVSLINFVESHHPSVAYLELAFKNLFPGEQDTTIIGLNDKLAEEGRGHEIVSAFKEAARLARIDERDGLENNS